MANTTVLISKDNPEGYKLEDLLTTLLADLELKTNELSGKLDTNVSAFNCSKKDVMCRILENDTKIMAALKTAILARNDSAQALATLGVDQGPTGTPRI